MSAETLFALMAKVLPIEDLAVEEIVEHAPPAPAFKPQPAQLKLSQKKPIKRRATRDLNSYTFAIDKGMNAILMSVLEDGQPHETAVFKPVIAQSGGCDRCVTQGGRRAGFELPVDRILPESWNAGR